MEADKERIIPITILSSQHHKSDENDNKGLSRSAAAANNNNDDHNDQVVRPKRQSLVVTLEDGTVTETLGILENQESTGHASGNSSLSIQELEQPVVRMVPIKLEDDGKMIQKEPEESMQTKAEFTNFTHQEFSDDKPPPEDIIPRMDSSPSQKSENGSQRIVPIQIVETGETLMPTFTKLEDPQPPPWSTFSKLNKAQEREVPLKMEEASEAKERGRAASQKTKVRFDLNDSSSIKSERRSSSVETYTRKTTVTSSKPPTDKQQPRRPVAKANEAAGPTAKWRTASAERPATMSPNTERTLQEIDRDINQIWRELQELEKLPNGGYRPRSTPPYSTATPSKTTPITPVKVKASYVAKPMTVTPTTQRRTIWDYEQENNNKIEANSSPIARPPRSQLPPPPPLPPHLRPSQPPKSVTIVAPIARDESCYDIGSTSPSVTSAYDNDLAETPNVNFKGFPYIDGAPSRKKPQKMEVTEAANASNNFSLLVDKSTQTPEEKLQRKAKEACAIL